MINLFNSISSAADLSATNGDVVLCPYKCTVRKEDNGDFYAAMELGYEFLPFIDYGKIIAINLPGNQGWQGFRIRDITRTRQSVTIKAPHVSFDGDFYVINREFPMAVNGKTAITRIVNAARPNNTVDSIPNPFTIDSTSDVATLKNYQCVRKSLTDALADVVERWGGHLTRDNWKIGIHNTIGSDNGVVLRYGKNLKELTVEEDWSEVCTMILPVGQNGQLLNAWAQSRDVYLINTQAPNYPTPFCRTVSFNQEDIDPDAYKDAQGNVDWDLYRETIVNDLEAQATAYMAAHAAPAITYTLDAHLERIYDVGDKIHLYDERLNVNRTLPVTAYEYDANTEKFTKVEFGTERRTLPKLRANIMSDMIQKLGIDGQWTVKVE